MERKINKIGVYANNNEKANFILFELLDSAMRLNKIYTECEKEIQKERS